MKAILILCLLLLCMGVSCNNRPDTVPNEQICVQYTNFATQQKVVTLSWLNDVLNLSQIVQNVTISLLHHSECDTSSEDDDDD